MARATKALANDRARKVLGPGAHVGARRTFWVDWRVEVYDPSGRIVFTTDHRLLACAYGDVVAWLGGRELNAEVA